MSRRTRASLLGVADRLQPARLQLGQGVKRSTSAPRPAGVRHGRHRRRADRLERPVVPLQFLVLRLRLAERTRDRGGRPGRPVGDPPAEDGHLFGGELLALQRHLPGTLLGDSPQQGALVRLARHHRRPGVAAGEQAVPVIHPQPAGRLGVRRRGRRSSGRPRIGRTSFSKKASLAGSGSAAAGPANRRASRVGRVIAVSVTWGPR